MTRPPDEINAETAPALAALQDLIYGEDTRDSEHSLRCCECHKLVYIPIGKAIAYKVDGNEEFKKRNYRDAVTAYSAGLKALQTGDKELTAVLLGNRAAAQYHLGRYQSTPSRSSSSSCALCVGHAGNYRSCLIDSDEARRAKPDYMKAILRGTCVFIHDDVITM